jgi:hypothetical protein
MYFGVLFVVVIAFVLYGLAHVTERTLEIRQQRRDQGDDSKVYL